jgi:hypothetical protein
LDTQISALWDITGNREGSNGAIGTAGSEIQAVQHVPGLIGGQTGFGSASQKGILTRLCRVPQHPGFGDLQPGNDLMRGIGSDRGFQVPVVGMTLF